MPLLAAQKNAHHTADVDVKKLLDELGLAIVNGVDRSQNAE